MPLRFGDCRLDVDARRLFRGSREIHLSPKAFALLHLLVETRPRAVAKSELLERVWPGVFVSESSLTRVVNQIRNGLGDAARRPRIIRTVHRYGYAFLAEVVDDTASSKPIGARERGHCWFVCGRRELSLTDGESIIGREADAGISLELASPKVSRRHAKLTVAGRRATIEDLGSKNGTSVRGVRISAPVTLEPGDEVRIGPFTLVFQIGIDATSTETEVVSLVQPGHRLPLGGSRTPRGAARLRRQGSG